jgi:hypothetical protein
MGWLGKQKDKHSTLGLHQKSTKCNDNQKTTWDDARKWMFVHVFYMFT